jgi:hypothetical protein
MGALPENYGIGAYRGRGETPFIKAFIGRRCLFLNRL